jgi:amino acid transporter
MATHEVADELLPKRLAMPIFASDPLSSNAYATEAALAVLLAASAASRHLILPLAVAIAILLAVVIASYRQIIFAYDKGGGGYTVSRENLGEVAGLISGASLMVDYVLTVAVSVVAAVLAITSAAPSLASHAVSLSLLLILGLLLGNLRGLRESGLVFSLPTYGFIISILVMIAVGITRGLTTGWPHAQAPDALPVGSASAIGAFVLLRAFASGCSALTGVEAISNGVTAFRPPQARNAASALVSMGVLSIAMFLGITVLAYQMDARPSSSVSVVSEVARGVFTGPLGNAGFYAVQVFTAAVLFLAANSAYQGFPRLLALLARDGYAPRQFRNLGDRLVYSNGLIMLTLLAGALVYVFDARVDSLLHLYLIGVFVAFTLAQVGMVRHTLHRRDTLPPGTVATRIFLNGLGAALTGLVTVIVAITKFGEGGWMVTVAVPAIVVACIAVNRHYRRVARALSAGYEPRESVREGTVVLVVTQIDDATLEALRYVESLVGRAFHPVHVVDDAGPGISRVWNSFHNDYPDGVPALEVVRRRGSLARTVVDYVRALPRPADSYVTVVVPELFRARTLGSLVQRRETLGLHLRLLRERDIVVTDVPIVQGSAETLTEIGTTRDMDVLVPISGINDAAMRALDYAASLRGRRARALYVDIDEHETAQLRRSWTMRLKLELQILDSPYRDLGPPLLAEIRRRTSDPNTVCMVVMPELVVPHRWQRLLHNQRALYLKRLLLFEERVILTTVPFQIRP